MENITDLKKKIRSVLLSSKRGVRKTEFLKEYKQLTGEGIDVGKTGFTTLDDFLGSIPDTVVRDENYYFAVSCDATDHLEKLIQQQKSDRRKLKTQEISSRHQKPGGRHYAKNEKRRLYRTKHDRFFRCGDDNRITRSVSMKQLTALPQQPEPSSSTRIYQKQTPAPATVDSSDLDELRTKLLSILYEAPLGLNTKDLQKEYKSETGRYIPLKEYGYRSVDELMLDFIVDNTMCIRKGPFFVAVSLDAMDKPLQNRRYVSTPNLHNRYFISGNGRRITIHKRFNEFNDNSSKLQMWEEGLSNSRHCVNTTDSKSKSPCGNYDCRCHMKNFNMGQSDRYNHNFRCCPHDISVADSPARRGRGMKPRTVTLVDRQEPNSTLKIQHGNLALQELRISVINTHLDDNNCRNLNRKIDERQKTTANYKSSYLNSNFNKIKSENQSGSNYTFPINPNKNIL